MLLIAADVGVSGSRVGAVPGYGVNEPGNPGRLRARPPARGSFPLSSTMRSNQCPAYSNRDDGISRSADNSVISIPPKIIHGQNTNMHYAI